MSIERRPENSDRMFANAEIFMGSVFFISGTMSTAAKISGGEQYLLDAVDAVKDYDPIAALIRITSDAGIPVQATLAAIIVVSAAIVADGIRRRDSNSSRRQ